jgi:hypothetical protein
MKSAGSCHEGHRGDRRRGNGPYACGLTAQWTVNAVFTHFGGCHPGVAMLAWYQHQEPSAVRYRPAASRRCGLEGSDHDGDS